MFKLTKINFFRILSILLLGSVYLPVVFMKLPYPFHTTTIYLFFFTFFTLVYYPGIFTSKLLLGVYLFMLIMFLGSVTFWPDIIGLSRFAEISKTIAGVFFALILNLYFMRSGDYKGYAIAIVFVLVFILISSITSIIGLEIFPGASRNMAAGSAADDFEMHITYLQIGITSYSFSIGAAFIMPCIAYFIRQEQKLLKKIIYLFMVFVTVFAINKAEHTTILLIAVVYFVFAFIKPKNNKLYYVLLTLLVAIFIFMPDIISNLLYYVSDNIKESAVTERFDDLGKTIESGNYEVGSSQTYTVSERLSRSLFSLNSFFENPLIGGGASAGHSFWLDRLALYGLLGIIPWFMIYYQSFKNNLKLFDDIYPKFYSLTIIASIVLGLIKGMGDYEVWISIFFIAPGIYFLKYLKKNKS